MYAIIARCLISARIQWNGIGKVDCLWFRSNYCVFSSGRSWIHIECSWLNDFHWSNLLCLCDGVDNVENAKWSFTTIVTKFDTYGSMDKVFPLVREWQEFVLLWSHASFQHYLYASCDDVHSALILTIVAVTECELACLSFFSLSIFHVTLRKILVYLV